MSLKNKIKSTIAIQFLVAVGIIANFSKEMLFAYYYGTSESIEAYRIAFGLPYSLFQSFGTVLVGVLLPLLFKQSERKGWQRVLNAQVQKFVFIVFILGVLTASLQASILAPGYADEKLANLEAQIRICWLFFLVVGQTFPVRLHMQSMGHLRLIAGTSLIFASLMVVLLIGLLSYGVQPVAGLLSWVSVLSGLGVLVGYMFYAKAQKVPFYIMDTFKAKVKKEDWIYLSIAFAMISLLINQAGRLVDRAFASGYPSGTIASIDYAYNIYTAFGLMIGTVAVLLLNKRIAKTFSQQFSKLDIYWLMKRLAFVALISVTVMALSMMFSLEMVSFVYQHGNFLLKDVHFTNGVLSPLMFAFPFMVVGMVMLQVMYAVEALKVLIVIGLFKLLVKAWVLNAAIDFNLSAFGQSTMFAEMVGVMLMLFYILYTYKRANR